MAKSLYKIHFRQNQEKAELCTLELRKEELIQLSEAIEDQYYFEFIVDDLPIRNFIGHLEEGHLIPHTHKILLWTHYSFTFEYHDAQIISANVSVSEPFELSFDNEDFTDFGQLSVPQSYSVRWLPTNVKYEDRMDRFKSRKFFPVTLEIHWLSVINSTVLAFLLISFVAVILTRVVKKDFDRYSGEKAAGTIFY